MKRQINKPMPEICYNFLSKNLKKFEHDLTKITIDVSQFSNSLEKHFHDPKSRMNTILPICFCDKPNILGYMEDLLHIINTGKTIIDAAYDTLNFNNELN